jgi:sugar phosphate isomerase/epimerase
MQIALITDEYTHDPFTAFELGRRWGVEHYEIRYAYRWRVPAGPPWGSDLVAAAVKAYDVTVTAVSPGLFKPVMRTDGTKIPLTTDTPDEIRRHLDDLLPRIIEFADTLGTKSIVGFALPKAPDATGPAPSIVIDSIGEAAEQVGQAGMRLLIENGAGSWADTGAASRAILEAVGSDALQMNWDPANVTHGGFAEDPLAEGFPLVQPYLAGVHVKDAVCENGKGRWVMLGDGRIDWQTQVATLRSAGYDGFLTVEPHLQYESPVGLVNKTEIFLQRLRTLLQQAGTRQQD